SRITHHASRIMAQTITVHSFRRGRGKTNIAANLAVLLAAGGRRVAIVDTDLRAPGVHLLFGLADADLGRTLNAYLAGLCPRPAQQHIQGTGVIIELARKLDVPHTRLIVSMVPSSLPPAEVAAEIERAYACPVAAVLPTAEEMLLLAGSGIFVLRHPNHPLT